MSARDKLRIREDGRFSFHCPACKCHHWFDNTWAFDGNFEAPTVAPSILTYGVTPKCHFFIRSGQIEYLMDCEHEYANMTIPMENEV